MKRFLSFLSVLVVVLSSLYVAVSADNNDPVTLNVFNWGEYISDGSEDSLDVNAEFEKYYEQKYGVKMTVNYSNYDTNETMYAKLKAGGANYDVITPSDYMISRLIKEDMLEKLNFDNIPNIDLIADEYRQKCTCRRIRRRTKSNANLEISEWTKMSCTTVQLQFFSVFPLTNLEKSSK